MNLDEFLGILLVVMLAGIVLIFIVEPRQSYTPQPQITYVDDNCTPGVNYPTDLFYGLPDCECRAGQRYDIVDDRIVCRDRITDEIVDVKPRIC